MSGTADGTDSASLQGFAPVADARTQALILGSFPSVASLAARQYYAHPRNQFWPLLAALWPRHPQPPDYAGRCEWLLARGLGLWDVYASCQRSGSLDSAIEHAQLNDLLALRSRCPRLRLVAHNGGESFRHAAITRRMGVPVVRLPSTSPANAGWNFARKLEAWRAALEQAGVLPAQPLPPSPSGEIEEIH